MPHEMLSPMPLIDFSDVVVHDHLPSAQEIIEVHDPDHEHEHHETHQHAPETIAVELGDDPSLDIEMYHGELKDEGLPDDVDVLITKNDDPILGIDLGDLPGAPPNTPDPEVEEDEEDLVVEDSDSSKSKDESEAKDGAGKKKDKWDWKSFGFGDFTVWAKERFEDVPKHTGYDIAGLERAHAYLEKLHSEISKAMRADLDGELEAQMIANLHDMIDEGLSKLEDRIEKVKGSKKKKKKADEEYGLVKEAQKIFGIQNGVVITVPLFISSLARVLVTGTVSSGKDIEDNYQKLVKKYKLTDRERMELIQLLQDMGMPLIRDRGLLPEDGLDIRSTENPEYPANYQA